jgi:hypothetical protein
LCINKFFMVFNSIFIGCSFSNNHNCCLAQNAALVSTSSYGSKRGTSWNVQVSPFSMQLHRERKLLICGELVYNCLSSCIR